MLDVAGCRARFPGLNKQAAGKPAVFFDGPAGSQVPASVADAVRDYLIRCNANHSGVFFTKSTSETTSSPCTSSPP